MNKLLEALRGASAPDRGEHRPVFFRPTLPDDRARLEELLKQPNRPTVHDPMPGQLRELVRSLNPSIRFTATELDRAAEEHLQGSHSDDYGTWVYYPWSNRLVHLLDEAEFTIVRTDRNRNKITREEQDILATKKVGVIGLSVGQSVSLTMAMERSFGEIRLADHDTLELSNLNRIRSGVHEMGVPKVINTAREIAEMDPFLTVTLFPEGISRDNIDRFLTEGGKLDVLVEECDSVDIKIMARQHAKALRIPVVMDTSDRGMLDIERFDLEPDRPILHGLVDHLDLELAAKARTNEEKLPFVLPIAGLDTLSPRMKASMLEIENSVTTWPQLASSVVMGGGIGGHLARRVVLGHAIPSGRWWMDPDELIGVSDQEPRSLDRTPELDPKTLSGVTLDEKAMVVTAELVNKAWSVHPLSSEEAVIISKAGCHAPSGGNCQPWRFLHHKGRLFVFLDGERAKSALDPGLRYAFLALGAAVENMLLQASMHGVPMRCAYQPLSNTTSLVAVLEVAERSVPTAGMQDSDLAEQIPLRCTNRRSSESLDLEPGSAQALLDVVRSTIPEATVTVVTDRETIDHVGILCGRAERIRFLNSTCHHDMFVREMRWNKDEAQQTGDGIDIATLELSLSDRTGLRIAADPKAMNLLRNWGAGKAMEKMGAKAIHASSALAIVSIPELGLSDAFKAGRATQRLWLKASSMGLLAHPVGAPIFMGIHGLWDTEAILSPNEHAEAGSVLKEFIDLIDLRDLKPFFMLRLGMGGPPTERSLRLPLEQVFLSTASELTAVNANHVTTAHEVGMSTLSS